MTAPTDPAPHPLDTATFGKREALAYDAVIRLCELTGRWRYPARASGDLEKMRFLDKAYWLFKTKHPIRRAARDSGLEAFFARQRPPEPMLPTGFRPAHDVRISSVGDLMIHPYLERSTDALYADVADTIFGADIVMGNLEFVVLDRARPLAMNMRTGPTPAFKPAEFHVVTGGDRWHYDFLAAACNHSLDFDEAGVASTIEALRGRGIAFHGLNERDDDAERVTVLERAQVRVGVVAHTFGLNGRRPPAGRPRIVNRMRLNESLERIDFSPLELQLRHCRDARVDFVVAHLHWGMEFEFYPRPEQLELAHRIAELGVDAIIGHHPHVLQPMEYYRTLRDPDRVVPIFYSLGNLTVPFTTPYLCRSGVARLEVAKGVDRDGTSRAYVKDARVVEVKQVSDLGRKVVAIRESRQADDPQAL